MIHEEKNGQVIDIPGNGKSVIYHSEMIIGQTFAMVECWTPTEIHKTRIKVSGVPKPDQKLRQILSQDGKRELIQTEY